MVEVEPLPWIFAMVVATVSDYVGLVSLLFRSRCSVSKVRGDCLSLVKIDCEGKSTAEERPPQSISAFIPQGRHFNSVFFGVKPLNVSDGRSFVKFECYVIKSFRIGFK